MTETYYDRLGVANTATLEEIQAAWKEKVRIYHPDVSDAPNATEEFKKIKEAYEVLSDGKERKRYDSLGHSAYVSDGQSVSHSSGRRENQHSTQSSRTHEETQQSARRTSKNVVHDHSDLSDIEEMNVPGSPYELGDSRVIAALALSLCALLPIASIITYLWVWITIRPVTGRWSSFIGFPLGALVLIVITLGVSVLAETLMDTERRLVDLHNQL